MSSNCTPADADADAAMTMGFVVGAYASQPADQEGQRAYHALLAETPWVTGVELPYPGALADDPTFVAGLLAEHWVDTTVTVIPGTMQTLARDPRFGLASPHDGGRADALTHARTVRDRVADLADITGRRAVARVQVHSAPTALASESAFAASLAELLTWDWSSAELVVEHCDADSTSHTAEKGFLPLDAELRVATAAGVGVHLNWGRSAVEGRSAETPHEHIVAAAAAGVLRGVLFSGAGPEATPYGPAWIDGHLPASVDEPASLMTPARIAECAAAARAGGARYLGAKICVPPEATLPERVAMLGAVRAATVA